MNSFWSNLYDPAKDRRYAALFVVTLALFFGLTILGLVLYLCLNPFDVHFLYLLPPTGTGVGVLVWKAFHQARRLRQTQAGFPPLSRDERHKARSKLLKARNFNKL